jgi:Holliday junction resolvase
MGKMSKNKGKVGERELAAELRRLFGVAARRGVQYSGGSDSPDVVTDIPGLHCEVKRTERLSLYPAVKQAVRDAGADKVPIVFHRQNREDWLAVIRLNDLPELIKLFSDFGKGE